MKKFLSVKYIPYFFYILSILGIILSVLFPDKIYAMWTIMIPYIIGAYMQVNANKNQPIKMRIIKFLISIFIGLIIISMIGIIILFII